MKRGLHMIQMYFLGFKVVEKQTDLMWKCVWTLFRRLYLFIKWLRVFHNRFVKSFIFTLI